MSKKMDSIIGGVFLFLTSILIYSFFTNQIFFEWAFARHHNILSWYIRPLFIIPIVIGAYVKSYTIISASIFSLFTSMFWFPIPSKVNDSVIGFLEFERYYLTSGWLIDKIVVLIAVLLFFLFLIISTWNRDWKLLIIVIVLSAFGKVIHSVVFGGSDGMAIFKPVILGVIICIFAVFLLKKRNK